MQIVSLLFGVICHHHSALNATAHKTSLHYSELRIHWIHQKCIDSDIFSTSKIAIIYFHDCGVIVHKSKHTQKAPCQVNQWISIPFIPHWHTAEENITDCRRSVQEPFSYYFIKCIVESSSSPHIYKESVKMISLRRALRSIDGDFRYAH